MICLDSSAWIEYFTAGPLGPKVRSLLKASKGVVVPSLCLIEVGFFLVRKIDKAQVGEYMAAMADYPVISLDHSLALKTLETVATRRLPLADAIIYATARHSRATLITLDNDFRGLEGVQILRRSS